MGLNSIPSANRIHIGFFGLRNAGKSSLVNKITNQAVSVVSDVPGTTTDPVYKSMELLPLGPVTVIDTPGYDDEGFLGQKRVQKTLQMISKTDIAILVSVAGTEYTDEENELISLFQSRNIPYIKVFNKCELMQQLPDVGDGVYVSAKSDINIDGLKNRIADISKQIPEGKRIFRNLLSEGDVVVLVTPIDESAPKGRLILPQVQSIRDVLDYDAVCVVTKENTYSEVLKILGNRVKLVVCDSQVFKLVNELTPSDIALTSFSILMARLKGYLEIAYKSIKIIDSVKPGDKILISEGCSHHRQCGDIGTVKLPSLIRKYTGVNPEFEFTQGGEFPDDLTGYKLVIHCGGCMLNEREVQSRMQRSVELGVPFSNYGIAIAYMNGIITRSTQVFEELR